MRILFNPSVSTPIMSKKSSAKKNIAANNLPVTDTVSFGSVKNYNEQMLEEIESVFQEKIKPFMKENEDLYKSIGIIGYNAQKSADFAEKTSSKYYMDFYKMLHDEPNLKLKNVQKYIDTGNLYNQNIQHFNRILVLSEMDMYSSSKELYETIKETAVYFKNCDELRKIKPIKDKAEEVKNSIMDSFSNNTLEAANPELYERIKDASETKRVAVYLMMVSPYQDALELEKQIKLAKENLNSPNRSFYHDSKIVEKIYNREDNILKNIENYKSQKQDSIDFVKQNIEEHVKFPSEDEITFAFEKLSVINKKSYLTKFEEVNSFYLQNYEQKGIAIDMDKADKELSDQNRALKKLDAIIDDIKTEYYAKQVQEL